ncbi:hypothetical protein Hanom_Chr09g00869461 [Helianthus anomalus]
MGISSRNSLDASGLDCRAWSGPLGNRCGYLSFIWSSRSHVNSGPRLEFQRTLTIGIRLCLRTLTTRSIISIGSSTNYNLSSIFSSWNGTTSVSSAKHFFNCDTWNTS